MTITWRWALYINLIIGGIFAPVYFFLLPSLDPQPGMMTRARFREIDFLGSFLSIVMFLCVTMAINFGGTLFAWKSAATLTLFAITALSLVLFILQQGFKICIDVSRRIFPVHFLRIRDAVLLFICAAACNCAGFVPIYYVPIYFQFTRGDTPIESAVRLLPLIMVLSATILANGALMARWGWFPVWYIGGSVLAIIGNAVICEWSSLRCPVCF